MMQPITFKEIGLYARDQFLEFLLQLLRKQVQQVPASSLRSDSHSPRDRKLSE
jgi:hypothetical protein